MLLCRIPIFIGTKRVEPRAAKPYPLLRSHGPRASAKTCYAPTATPPTIVLPAFARSLSADGKKLKEIVVIL
jgi:hypothetical protein